MAAVDDDWAVEDACPVCGSNLVKAYGPKRSKILLVGEFPGDEEMLLGVPMIGAMGGVLRQELARFGIDLKALRRMNLWQHTPNNKPECFMNGAETVMKEAKGRSLIVLMGSDTVKYFAEKSVSNVNGLQVPAPFKAPFVLAMMNPAIVFHEGVGELRFALKTLASVVEKL